MATYDVQRDIENDSSGSSIDEEGFITLTASQGYTILLSEATTETSVSVLENAQTATPKLPKQDDTHPENPKLFVNDITMEKLSPIYYTAIVQYASVPFRDGDDPSSSPTDLPVEVEWDTIESEEPIDTDRDGNPWEVPYTREPIGGLTTILFDQEGTFTKNVILYSPVVASGWTGRVNSNEWFGFPIGTLRIRKVKAKLAKKGQSPYWVMTIVITSRKPYRTTNAKAWWKRIRCQGFYEVARDGVVRAVDDDGFDVTQPIPIDANNGQRLPEGQQIQYLEKPEFEELNFDILGLF